MIITVGKSDYISFTGGLATILALFCSVSFGYLLHHNENAKSERQNTLNLLFNELNTFKEFVYRTEESELNVVCEKFVLAYEQLGASDFPLLQYLPEHEEFGDYLTDEIYRSCRFTRQASSYVMKFESINDRLNLIAIKQIVSKLALNTLGKGVALVALLVAVYLFSLLSFTQTNQAAFISIHIFSVLMTTMVFAEFVLAMSRFMDEELEFVDRESKT
ncbi:hypothetical protein [Vibrio parahaemolyticus]|uniref:hypothetical protein n=1 Tax=Vibrio parahaemolyticus TaxID=670 RepID=UPI001EECDE4E|nr:hypothetical protein [Vibrio parahaemolyticus]MCG6481050.1 hypothetical protein [Vibrio parahaemolyticus]HCG6765621.1 hypothetical protein [Vibrio parahaemolyticus]